MKKITIDYLKKIKACPEGVKFFQSGNFEKLDWENFDLKKNIIGDYKSFVLWLKDTLADKGVIYKDSLYHVIPNLYHRKKDWVKEEFDKNKNRVYAETKSGYWEKKEYDENNNEVYFERVSGSWIKRKFDKNNNEIYFERNRNYYFESKYLKLEREFIYNSEDILIKIKENGKTIFEIKI